MSDLDRLFYWRGIAPDFYSFRGEHTPVSLENRLILLNAMGVDTETPEAIAAAAYDLDIKPWLCWLPALEVIYTNHPQVEINFKPDELDKSFTWCLDNKGSTVRGEFLPSQLPEVGDYQHQNTRYSRRVLSLEDLHADYYDLTLSCDEQSQTSCLAVCPPTAYEPDWVHQQDVKPWGFVIQLYTLRSAENWGYGDFSDLYRLLSCAAEYGVDVIGLNPFHALQADLSENFSPYSPSDRRFLNPLYIDVTAAPGYCESFKPTTRITALQSQEHIYYPAVQEVKYEALYRCFTAFLPQLTPEFTTFISSLEGLLDFAIFEVRHNQWTSANLALMGVNQSPEQISCELSDSAQLDLSSLVSTNALALTDAQRLLLFHCYMQWVASKQLARCDQHASALGMKVGLIRDLAVGASGGGSEVQSNAHLFCTDASVGAPPDPLALTGQNWGLPPMDPAELRRTAFTHYIALLRANMASCGALRIDHAMSLYRLWWCPPEATADQGAYVYYPMKELMGLLCLESHLNQCVIIAEDLGIVPEDFKAAMDAAKLFSNKVFYFEKWSDVEFKHPHQYQQHALAMLDNHDVPTITSWWNGSDLALRNELNLLEVNVALEQVLEHRQREKQKLYDMLHHDGLLPADWHNVTVEQAINESLVGAIVKFVAQTQSKLFVLQLEDLLMVDEPVNVPGTFLEHKNWSRKLSCNTDEIFKNENIQALLRSISEYRTR